MAHDGSDDDAREVSMLVDRAHALYDALKALPQDDDKHRRMVWSEIVEIQDRISELLPPDPPAG